MASALASAASEPFCVGHARPSDRSGRLHLSAAPTRRVLLRAVPSALAASDLRRFVRRRGGPYAAMRVLAVPGAHAQDSYMALVDFVCAA